MPFNHDFITRFKEQILKCSRCGYCRAVCPVFGATLRPSYNARGKMLLLKEVIEGHLELTDELTETLFQCTTCGSCTVTCPAGVEVAEILKTVRRDMVKINSCHPKFKGLNEVLARHTNIYAEDDPMDFGRERNRQADYVYFIGCVGQYREEESTEAALDILDHLKINFTLIDEVCCSGVLEDVGYKIHDHLAEKNIAAIAATGAGTVITGCPYCYRSFTQKEQYRKLIEAGIAVMHISQFLKNFDFGVTTDLTVTYHDPCDLGRHNGIYEAPRETIRKIAPNFVELPAHHEEALCCGAGGGVRGAFPRNSLAMARRRLEHVDEIRADVLLTDCNSCVHNLSNAKLRKQKFEIYTTVQFLKELLDL